MYIMIKNFYLYIFLLIIFILIVSFYNEYYSVNTSNTIPSSTSENFKLQNSSNNKIKFK